MYDARIENQLGRIGDQLGRIADGLEALTGVACSVLVPSVTWVDPAAGPPQGEDPVGESEAAEFGDQGRAT